MRIVTNPGANLSEAIVSYYGIELSPQQIVVDGRSYDTREPISLADVDAWVANAKEHPYVIGTTAAEFAALFAAVGRGDADILAVMTSRKIISSYDAACSATRTLAAHARQGYLNVRVVDTTVTDIGAGLICMLAGEAVRAGLGFDAIEDLALAAADRSRLLFYVQEFDYLVKGGRASFLKATLAKMLGVRPVLTMRDGELAPLATIRRSVDPIGELIELFGRMFPPGTRLWVGISHGGRPEAAASLLDAVKSRYDVRWSQVSAPSPAIYLHTGPGSLAMFVLRLDGLPWDPPNPPSFTPP